MWNSSGAPRTAHEVSRSFRVSYTGVLPQLSHGCFHPHCFQFTNNPLILNCKRYRPILT